MIIMLISELGGRADLEELVHGVVLHLASVLDLGIVTRLDNDEGGELGDGVLVD